MDFKNDLSRRFDLLLPPMLADGIRVLMYHGVVSAQTKLALQVAPAIGPGSMHGSTGPIATMLPAVCQHQRRQPSLRFTC